MDELVRLHRAAVRIQTIWRGKEVRKAIWPVEWYLGKREKTEATLRVAGMFDDKPELVICNGNFHDKRIPLKRIVEIDCGRCTKTFHQYGFKNEKSVLHSEYLSLKIKRKIGYKTFDFKAKNHKKRQIIVLTVMRLMNKMNLYPKDSEYEDVIQHVQRLEHRKKTLKIEYESEESRRDSLMTSSIYRASHKLSSALQGIEFKHTGSRNGSVSSRLARASESIKSRTSSLSPKNTYLKIRRSKKKATKGMLAALGNSTGNKRASGILKRADTKRSSQSSLVSQVTFSPDTRSGLHSRYHTSNHSRRPSSNPSSSGMGGYSYMSGPPMDGYSYKSIRSSNRTSIRSSNRSSLSQGLPHRYSPINDEEISIHRNEIRFIDPISQKITMTIHFEDISNITLFHEDIRDCISVTETGGMERQFFPGSKEMQINITVSLVKKMKKFGRISNNKFKDLSQLQDLIHKLRPGETLDITYGPPGSGVNGVNESESEFESNSQRNERSWSTSKAPSVHRKWSTSRASSISKGITPIAQIHSWTVMYLSAKSGSGSRKRKISVDLKGMNDVIRNVQMFRLSEIVQIKILGSHFTIQITNEISNDIRNEISHHFMAQKRRHRNGIVLGLIGNLDAIGRKPTNGKIHEFCDNVQNMQSSEELVIEYDDTAVTNNNEMNEKIKNPDSDSESSSDSSGYHDSTSLSTSTRASSVVYRRPRSKSSGNISGFASRRGSKSRSKSREKSHSLPFEQLEEQRKEINAMKAQLDQVANEKLMKFFGKENKETIEKEMEAMKQRLFEVEQLKQLKEKEELEQLARKTELEREQLEQARREIAAERAEIEREKQEEGMQEKQKGIEFEETHQPQRRLSESKKVQTDDYQKEIVPAVVTPVTPTHLEIDGTIPKDIQEIKKRIESVNETQEEMQKRIAAIERSRNETEQQLTKSLTKSLEQQRATFVALEKEKRKRVQFLEQTQEKLLTVSEDIDAEREELEQEMKRHNLEKKNVVKTAAMIVLKSKGMDLRGEKRGARNVEERLLEALENEREIFDRFENDMAEIKKELARIGTSTGKDGDQRSVNTNPLKVKERRDIKQSMASHDTQIRRESTDTEINGEWPVEIPMLRRISGQHMYSDGIDHKPARHRAHERTPYLQSRTRSRTPLLMEPREVAPRQQDTDLSETIIDTTRTLPDDEMEGYEEPEECEYFISLDVDNDQINVRADCHPANKMQKSHIDFDSEVDEQDEMRRQQRSENRRVRRPRNRERVKNRRKSKERKNRAEKSTRRKRHRGRSQQSRSRSKPPTASRRTRRRRPSKDVIMFASKKRSLRKST